MRRSGVRLETILNPILAANLSLKMGAMPSATVLAQFAPIASQTSMWMCTTSQNVWLFFGLDRLIFRHVRSKTPPPRSFMVRQNWFADSMYCCLSRSRSHITLSIASSSRSNSCTCAYMTLLEAVTALKPPWEPMSFAAPDKAATTDDSSIAWMRPK